MFTSLFVELCGLLGSLVVGGLILLVLGVIVLFGFMSWKAIQAVNKESKKENTDELPKM